MAGWIKMRSELVGHPKVVAMARLLNAEHAFREWLMPGGGGVANGQIVSSPALHDVTAGALHDVTAGALQPVTVAALRYVAVAALLCVWSRARESGEFVGNDLVLPHTTVDDLDEMAGVPGVGQAMVKVGWVIAGDGGCGVTLPNFKRYNAPMDAAERVRRHRCNANVTAGALHDVTAGALHDVTRVTRQRREEKRREELNTNTGAPKPNDAPVAFPPEIDTPTFRVAWSDYVQYRREQKFKALGATAVRQKFRQFAEWGEARAVAALRYSMANGWQGIFEENANDKSGLGKNGRGNANSAEARRERARAAEYEENIVLPVFDGTVGKAGRGQAGTA